MRNLSDTLINLRRVSKHFEAVVPVPPNHFTAGRLQSLPFAGENPGDLDMYAWAPPPKAGRCPLVVALHGCTQTAEGFDLGTGWSALAQQHNFAVLAPQQRRANNPNLCFNWFSQGDASRGNGEAASIRAMIAAMIGQHDIDPQRIYVTGLSAGGAMASAMLASYPEVFAAGAIVAGLPFGGANSVSDAFQSMAGLNPQSAGNLGSLVRDASPHAGEWPRVSVWHGDADSTVQPANAHQIVAQWLNVHGVDPNRVSVEPNERYTRQTWNDADGKAVVELYEVGGMSHGVPLAVRDGEPQSGVAGPFHLDVGVPSTEWIAGSWGLVDNLRRVETPSPTRPTSPAFGSQPGLSIEGVINKALKAAGLVK